MIGLRGPWIFGVIVLAVLVFLHWLAFRIGHADVEEVRLTLPNKHHLLVDLSPFGLENKNEIFVATEEPFGLIEATLRR